MKKLLLFTLVCAYGMSISAMESNQYGWWAGFSMFWREKGNEQESAPQNLPEQESSEKLDVTPEIDWKKLGEQAEQTIFQNCKEAIENRDNSAVNLLSSIPSVTTRAQLIALAKGQVTIDKFRVKQSIKKNGASMVGSLQLLPNPDIKNDYEKSVMVLAGLKKGKLS